MTNEQPDDPETDTQAGMTAVANGVRTYLHSRHTCQGQAWGRCVHVGVES